MLANEVVSNECDDVLDNVAPCVELKCGESALYIQQNYVAKETKYVKEFRSRYAMFVNHCNINNGCDADVGTILPVVMKSRKPR